MIVSKPKGNTLFALGMFLLICFGLLGYTLFNYLTYEIHYWYQYLIFLIITPISIVVLIKTFQSYKIIKLGKGKISIRYPFLFKAESFSMKDLDYWKEEVIKTQGTAFKELTISFKQGKANLSSQENGEYHKIFTYLHKKHSKSRR